MTSQTTPNGPATPATVPAYLAEKADLYATDPRRAAIEWFREAQFGLFMHYGLYSLLGGKWKGEDVPGAEWIRLKAPICFDEYEQLTERFTAEAFDAGAICDLALAAGMRYVNLTTVHHDGFCLWDTATCDFKGTNTPAGRDLVAELVEACDERGLGCFFYYSHGRDWYHPHAPDSGASSCRPDCPPEREPFATGDDVDLQKYVDFVAAQVDELCTNYAPVAGIWLDGIGEPLRMERGAERMHVQALYDRIHAASPHILVSYKQGLTGTEDFFAPEHDVSAEQRERAAQRPYEICTTLQENGWGYRAAEDGKHRGPDWVMEKLAEARAIPANLLLNTGPKGDGSIPEADVRTLREVGRRRA